MSDVEIKEKEITYWNARIAGFETALSILKHNEPETSNFDVMKNEKED